MPTYIYRREDGSTFEIDQKITDDALTEDENGAKVERVMSAFGIRFKGTGFHNNDYGKKEENDKAETNSDS